MEKEIWRGLGAADAKRFYDSIGKKQDIQFYENRALSALTSFSNFGSASSVFEFGCGTGRFAVGLLTKNLSDVCAYHGVDISETMIGLADERLKGWSSRASVGLVGGGIGLEDEPNTYDRFVSTYVLDLLSEDDTRGLLSEAHRILKPGGLLCVVSLTHGDTPFCRLISAAWSKLFAFKPYWVGGCRPVDVGKNLDKMSWEMVHDEIVSAFGISSEVLVARVLKQGGNPG